VRDLDDDRVRLGPVVAVGSDSNATVEPISAASAISGSSHGASLIRDKNAGLTKPIQI
jgi:hypothetical protein